MWIAAWVLSIALTLVFTTRLKAAPDVVFFGDSITEMWTLPAVNFGIYGNTTGQMLSRFNDVTDSYFTRVVLLGGTNDVLTGVDPATTIGNLHQMIQRALQKKMEVLVGTIPPIYQDNGSLLPKVDALNRQIAQEVNRWKDSGARVRLVDFNESLQNSRNGFAIDGVHMRRRNYVRMDLKLLSVNNIFFRKN
ncbi:GDSL-type esterase/lipase family protein [Silvibacterium acidisoli]|uniref:GDSL-type esterase/lipase family protein n=1 Tax=Acidobacteriaceae bacterium ZG23-2 TaxID=2883246 RepID=UPI00406C5BB8